MHRSPNTRRRPFRGRARDERGAALVEAAIIFPVLVMLTFGAIELGIGYGKKAGLEAASRAGGRKAATLTDWPDNPPFYRSFSDEVVDAVNAALSSNAVPKVTRMYVFKNNTGIDPASTCNPGECVRYDATPDGKQFDKTTGVGTFPMSSRNGCGANPDRVSVKLLGEYDFLSGVIGTSVNLNAQSTYQLEPTNC